MADWISDLLIALQAPDTARNREFLRNWGSWESAKPGSPATFNWLSSNRGDQYRAINEYNIRAYPDYATGMKMTIETIVKEFPNILKALRTGNPTFNDPGIQRDFNKWGPEGTSKPGMSEYIKPIAESLRPTPAPPTMGPLFIVRPKPPKKRVKK